MAITKEQEHARPTGTLGIERWVQFSFLGCAVAAAWFLIKAGTATWRILSDNIDVISEPNATVVAAAAGAIALGGAVVAYRSDKIHGFVTQVCVELSKVTWPTRSETWSQTIIVIVVSVIAAVVLGLFDMFWSTITDLIY